MASEFFSLTIRDTDLNAGIIKTHRLLMLTPTALLAPNCQGLTDESKVTIGPRALKDVIDHFSVNTGGKSDPQLVWTFADGELVLRSSESAIGNKGREQLSTELTLSADEFDDYDISSPPITVAFHLREFNATIAFTDSMSLSLEMRFTEPASPLFIDVEGDGFDCLFVLSTNQVTGTQNTTQSQATASSSRKRDRDETTHETPRMKKPMKAVQPAPLPSGTRAPSMLRTQPRPPNSINPLPSTSRPAPSSFFSDPPLAESTHHGMPPPPVPFKALASSPVQKREPSSDAEPLFLPCSQLSQNEVEALRSTGLGIEDMNADEFADMLEGEGEEVDFSQAQVQGAGANYNYNKMDQALEGPDSFELVDEFGATQSSSSQSKEFQPLFED
ncbi:hypothetical protein D9611_000358 [Ephemerocybe angulata]|uniref:Uncharacterized protein n=1 Tax=Ephemerocybe angulata TaxID=980116 RepID=A0A8H5BM24_9AGAR|nr:hypothetical protein D9611_000358 [Tulosesus angulatus]